MLAEKIEVTDTLTTIQSLLETARGVVAGSFKPTKCVGIMLRYDVVETSIVTMKDENSVNGVVILDVATEVVSSVSFKQFDISKVSLIATVAVDVHMIIEQTLM